jgi:hypothetical protein
MREYQFFEAIVEKIIFNKYVPSTVTATEFRQLFYCQIENTCVA